MSDYYENVEDMITPEQSQKWDLCKCLYDSFVELLEAKRCHALNCLDDCEVSIDEKRQAFTEYFSFRLSNEEYVCNYENCSYNGNDMIKFASELYSDTSFPYSDGYVVLNCLGFFESSINLVDEFLAFHNYRLNKNEYNLSIIVNLLSKFIKYNLGNELFTFSFSPNKIGSSIEESTATISLMIDELCRFCTEYYSDIEEQNFILSYDISMDLSNQLDYDAGEYLCITDAIVGRTDPFYEIYGGKDESTPPKSEDEIHKIKAEFAGKRISTIIYSMYLLVSLIKEMDNDELTSNVSDLKKVHRKLFDKLYPKYDLEDVILDNHISNHDSLHNRELSFEKECLRTFIKSITDALETEDYETILRCRKKSIIQAKINGINNDDTNDIIDSFSMSISKLLIKKVGEDSLDHYKTQLKKQLGSKYELLNADAIKTLATAELLYDKYVNDNRIDGFDYSGIAALYFQSFETAYDSLIITPYAQWCNEAETNQTIEEYCGIIKKKKNNKTPEDISREKELKQILVQYFDVNNVANFSNFYKSGKIQETMTLGAFYNLWDWMKKNYYYRKEASKFIAFLESEKCFGKASEREKSNRFHGDLKNAITPRNNASHGGNTINRTTVQEDKEMVYDNETIAKAVSYKNLLFQLLDFFA